MNRLDYLQQQSSSLHVDALLSRVSSDPAYLPTRKPRWLDNVTVIGAWAMFVVVMVVSARARV